MLNNASFLLFTQQPHSFNKYRISDYAYGGYVTQLTPNNFLGVITMLTLKYLHHSVWVFCALRIQRV